MCVCVRSPNSAQFFVVFLSYGPVFCAGRCARSGGSVPGVAAMCASFLAVELTFSS